ncbi:hypothetical protein GPECTOR_1g637 [Gonium pectorale]|uniref:Phosphoglycerate mutase n=1 Tax=Gonium pectorale TaxID=33097 RepID=A0A150H3G3_GONPE|nr:hypothetical protein GPECTOR_1g637 [Gonium pectorale]|eukprot:KXZ56707.1 hypothetical protein GPECTOR_1g637 [Gonium pectorale]
MEPGSVAAAAAQLLSTSPNVGSAFGPLAAPAARGAAHTVVLVRHGESEWNLANRFTGWTDVDLTAQGRRQATAAGALLHAHGFRFDLAFTSVLKRAIRTLHLMEDAMDALYVPEVKSWRLNERHYGGLQGLNKAETAAQHGEEQVHIWRRSYSTPPPPLELTDPRHPRYDPRYSQLSERDLPAAESLQDCVARILPFWRSDIAPAVSRGRRVLVAAHGNSLRGIVKHLDGISDTDIMSVEIPVGAPLVYELDASLAPLRRYYLGALVVSGATTPGHVHTAAGAAALAGDLADAEDLMLRGAMAAADYLFATLHADALAAAGAAPAPSAHAPAPAGPLEEAMPSEVAVDAYASGFDAAGGGASGDVGLEAFKRAAPLIDAARHVVVALPSGEDGPESAGAAAGVGAAHRGLELTAALAKRILDVLGGDKKLVLAMPRLGADAGSGSRGLGRGAAGMPAVMSDKLAAGSLAAGELPAAWRGGGWVYGAGAASSTDVHIVAEALTCATGNVWSVPRIEA